MQQATMRKSILSERINTNDRTIRAIGKIRPGIKVLTKAAQNNAEAVAIYNEGVNRRLKFSEIDKMISAKTGISNPSYPKNTQYFTVSSSDFGGMPEIASKIVETYGNADPDGVKRLYRFPVVFHSDDLEEIYPNSMQCYGAKINYESHYGEDGVRYCRYLPIVDAEKIKEQRAARVKKVPRREKVIRGVCNPRACQEYGLGQCKFRGTLHFYIPGTATTGLLAMVIGSEDAALQIWESLERIKEMLGTIPRSNPNNPSAHVFYISKVEVETSYYDDNGERKKGKQWVPQLVADIDIGKLLQIGYKQEKVAVLTQQEPPANWLESTTEPTPATKPLDDGDADPSAELHKLSQLEIELELDEDVSSSYLANKLGEGWEKSATKIQEAIQTYEKFKPIGKDGINTYLKLSLLAQKNQISAETFHKFAVGKFGKNYKRISSALAQLLKQLIELDGSGPGNAKAFVEAEIANL